MFAAPRSTITPSTRRIEVGGVGAIAATEGAVWTQGKGGGVVRIDPTTNRVAATVPVEGLPFEIAAGEDGVWVTGSLGPGASGDLLHRIDPDTNRVVATISFPGRFAGPLAAGEGAVWLALTDHEDDSDSLARIDPETNEVALTVPLGLGRAGWVAELAVNEGAVWLLAPRGAPDKREERGDVIRFDPEGNQVEATIPAEAVNLGVGPGGVWITGRVDSEGHRETFFAQKIDPRVNALVGPRVAVEKVGFGPLFVAKDSVWFSGYDRDENTVAFSLDPETHNIEEFLRVGSFLHAGTAFDPERAAVWVASAPSSVVRVNLNLGR